MLIPIDPTKLPARDAAEFKARLCADIPLHWYDITSETWDKLVALRLVDLYRAEYHVNQRQALKTVLENFIPQSAFNAL